MSDVDPRGLERRMHEALATLPARRAPASLCPRVMASVRARAARPWYARPWDAWPLPAQAVAVLVAAVVVGAGAWWLPAGVSEVSGITSVFVRRIVAGLPAALPDDVQRAVSFAGAAQVVWRTVLGPALFYAAIVSVVVGGALMSGAALLTRMAVGRPTG